MNGLLKQWSYSTLKNYKQCPRKVKFSKIDHIKEPGSPAMDRGNAIHKEAELFVKEKQARLPESLIKFKKEFFKLVKNGDEVHTEDEWAFTEGWQVTDWKAADAWVRLKLDAFYVRIVRGKKVLTVIDYKTGKVYDDHKGQLSFYAMACMLRPEFADVDKVECELWYIDIGPEATARDFYERSELADMQSWWVRESFPMLNDTVFAPRPGWYCGPNKSGTFKGCFFSKCNNGPCEY